jgi:hypothetical protein
MRNSRARRETIMAWLAWGVGFELSDVGRRTGLQQEYLRLVDDLAYDEELRQRYGRSGVDAMLVTYAITDPRHAAPTGAPPKDVSQRVGRDRCGRDDRSPVLPGPAGTRSGGARRLSRRRDPPSPRGLAMIDG